MSTLMVEDYHPAVTDLLGTDSITGDVEEYLATVGRIFTAFRRQDSGCVAFGVESSSERFFVKTALEAHAVPGLLRAQKLSGDVRHPALPALRHVAECPRGPVLIYDFVDGEVLNPAGTTADERDNDPTHPHYRFRALPVDEIVHTLDVVYDLLLLVAKRGHVAVDWYDGCLLYDFVRGSTYVCDLDEFRESPFTLEEERLPGSTRFMAPEELTRGARIDQVTNVFTCARTAQILLRDRLTRAMRDVLDRATQAERSRRHESVEAFVLAWRDASR